MPAARPPSVPLATSSPSLDSLPLPHFSSTSTLPLISGTYTCLFFNRIYLNTSLYFMTEDITKNYSRHPTMSRQHASSVRRCTPLSAREKRRIHVHHEGAHKKLGTQEPSINALRRAGETSPIGPTAQGVMQYPKAFRRKNSGSNTHVSDEHNKENKQPGGLLMFLFFSSGHEAISSPLSPNISPLPRQHMCLHGLSALLDAHASRSNTRKNCWQ